LATLSIKKWFLLSGPPVEPFPPGTGHQGAELSTSLSTSPPQEAAESREVAPQPPALQTRQTQSPQPLLREHTCQPLPQLWGPPQDAFKSWTKLPLKNKYLDGSNSNWR